MHRVHYTIQLCTRSSLPSSPRPRTAARVLEGVGGRALLERRQRLGEVGGDHVGAHGQPLRKLLERAPSPLEAPEQDTNGPRAHGVGPQDGRRGAREGAGQEDGAQVGEAPRAEEQLPQPRFGEVRVREAELPEVRPVQRLQLRQVAVLLAGGAPPVTAKRSPEGEAKVRIESLVVIPNKYNFDSRWWIRCKTRHHDFVLCFFMCSEQYRNTNNKI